MKSPVFAGILLSTVAAAGCGSDTNTTVDGRPIRPDALVVDAAAPDAPGPTFGGTISLLEASVIAFRAARLHDAHHHNFTTHEPVEIIEFKL